jgi:glutaminyl-tRNA synthetase
MLVKEFSIAEADATIIAGDDVLSRIFTGAAAEHDARAVANWVVNELAREVKDLGAEEIRIDGHGLAGLAALVDGGTISRTVGKEIFAEIVRQGGDPASIVESRGLKQVTDGDTLGPVIDGILEAHPDKIEAYRNGKTGLLGFFVGEVMKQSQGRANPATVKELLSARLGSQA